MTSNDDSYLLKKYFECWRNYKSDKFLLPKLLDSEKVERFIEFIQKEKEKLAEKNRNKTKIKLDSIENPNLSEDVVDCKVKNAIRVNPKCELSRLHVQTHTIALLKAQLEQKERIIEQMKLNKIVEDGNCSTDIVNDVKWSLNHCSISVKPKLKCIIKENRNIEPLTEENFQVHCMKVPKFLQQMEKRAREREEKRKIVAERRKQIELEKERIKEQMRLEKEIKDQEERTKRIREFREKHKREQLLAIKRKEFMERLRSLFVMADLHHEKKIYIKYGDVILKRFMMKIREDREKALRFNERRIIRIHFIKFSIYVKEVVRKRTEKAEAFYENKLKVMTFNRFKLIRREMLCKLYTAEDWYDNYITNKLFMMWKENADKSKQHKKQQWILAISHHERRLKWKVVGCWQNLPLILSMEREREARKQRWRLKVQQVLPDFIPRDII